MFNYSVLKTPFLAEGVAALKTGLQQLHRLIKWVCSSQNCLAELLEVFNIDVFNIEVFVVVKTCVTIRHKHSTGFAIVKKGLLNIYTKRVRALQHILWKACRHWRTQF